MHPSTRLDARRIGCDALASAYPPVCLSLCVLSLCVRTTLIEAELLQIHPRSIRVLAAFEQSAAHGQRRRRRPQGDDEQRDDAHQRHGPAAARHQGATLTPSLVCVCWVGARASAVCECGCDRRHGGRTGGRHGDERRHTEPMQATRGARGSLDPSDASELRCGRRADSRQAGSGAAGGWATVVTLR